MEKIQLELAIAHAYARGKKRRELVARVERSKKLRKIRGSTAEEIVRQMAHQEEK